MQFSTCDANSRPEDNEVVWIDKVFYSASAEIGNQYEFTYDKLRCMTINFKAVIYPVSTQ
jgi:hypothetical protein